MGTIVITFENPGRPQPIRHNVAGATYNDDEKLEISEFNKESNGLLIYIISSYKQDGDCRDRNNNRKEKHLQQSVQIPTIRNIKL
jgi:hypothetical protein